VGSRFKADPHTIEIDWDPLDLVDLSTAAQALVKIDLMTK
jgi:hypothetical protein